jgi:pilus biogenesis lipoprotein CpaD
MQSYKLILLVGTLGFALTVSACDVTTPSDVNTSKLKVKDQVITETLSADHVDLKHVAAIAQKVTRNGNGEVDLTIPYLQGGMVRAEDLGTAYKDAFARQHVSHVSVALVAMTGSQDADSIVASYQVLTAQQAEGCGRIPGYQGPEDMDNYDGYQYGCETQANLAKEIADPTDLLGKENPTEANSRRNGAIIEPYMLGTPNTPLKGMSASDVGKQ